MGVVQRPTKKKVLCTKWLWKAEYKAGGSLEKFKPNLVAQGYFQRDGFNVQETLDPPTHMTTIQTIITLLQEDGRFIIWMSNWHF